MPAETCTHRCMQGRDCGGCGCPGCGYGPASPPPRFTIEDGEGFGRWLRDHESRQLLNQDIAVLLTDASDGGPVIAPEGWSFHADCVTDGEGTPEGWRIFIRHRGWPGGLNLASDCLETATDSPDGADLITEAVEVANDLLAAWATARP